DENFSSAQRGGRHVHTPRVHVSTDGELPRLIVVVFAARKGGATARHASGNDYFGVLENGRDVAFARRRHFAGRGKLLGRRIIDLRGGEDETMRLPAADDQHSEVRKNGGRFTGARSGHVPARSNT